MKTADLLIGAGLGAALAFMFDPQSGRRRRTRVRDGIYARLLDDARIAERVSAKLARVCSYPHAIDVECEQGEVTLRGLILSSEIDGVLAAVATVRGERSLINELEPHDSADEAPTLYGDGRATHLPADLLEARWTPRTRALVATAGLAATGALAAYARR